MIHPDQDVQWLYLVFETYYFKHLPDYRIITMDPCTSDCLPAAGVWGSLGEMETSRAVECCQTTLLRLLF